MARSEDWKYLKSLRENEYKINVIFVSVNDVATLNKRISTRHASGEAHFVPATIVKGRYNACLRLLDHYFNVSDRLTLLDNSTQPIKVMEAEKGHIVFKADPLPEWVKKSLASRLNPEESQHYD